jgi:Zn ribbon nucleic-acid-binding protein
MSHAFIQNEDRFRANVKGKCCDCQTQNTLDSMIRKDNIKGQYHCIDCETNQQILYNYEPLLFPNINKAVVNTELKIRDKLQNFLFGK